MIKLAFECNQRHIIWTFHQGVMIILVQTALKVNSLPRTGYWYNFSFNIVPSSRVLWCMLYMVGNLIKSSFQRIQQHIIWTSEQGVMTILLKVTQKPRRRMRIEDHFGNASPVGLPSSNVETSVHSYLRDLFLV